MDRLPYQPHSITSRQAAAAYAGFAKNARQRVYLAIEYAGPAGMTDEEIVDVLSMNPNTARPRRIELVAAGLITDSTRTRLTRSGTAAVVWVQVRGAEYDPNLFIGNQPEASDLQGLAKAVYEIEQAIVEKKRSPELRNLLDKLHDDLDRDEDSEAPQSQDWPDEDPFQ
jgi:hypothetical protein